MGSSFSSLAHNEIQYFAFGCDDSEKFSYALSDFVFSFSMYVFVLAINISYL